MYSNDWTRLVNKIERRLGLLPLTPHLPSIYQKDAWVDVLKEDTLPTFSRYYPYKIKYVVNKETTKKIKGRYYINDDLIGGAKILGITDIEWSDFGADNQALSQVGPYGYYSPGYYGTYPCSIEQMLGYKLNADIASLFNTGVYIEFYDPNAFEVRGAGNIDFDLEPFIVNVLVEHQDLSTISPTKMETFEELALTDVAAYLYRNLNHYDGLETVYANVDLKLQELENEAGKRDNVIEKLENGYVSASNDTIPYILSI